MGGFEREALRETFDVPEQFTAMAMIAIGHPGRPDELPEAKKISELKPRQRVPLAEIAFERRWNAGFDI